MSGTPGEPLGERPNLTRRDAYHPRARQEWFIVTRLAAAIPAAIQAFCANPPKPRRCLDVGCGGQPFRSLVESLGFSYLGMDAKQNEQQAIDHIGVIDGDLAPGLQASAPYSFILCTEVMEHVADWSRAFANLAQLLAPGGRLLITCPHVYPLHEEPYDFWRPTPYALKHFAAQSGLTIIHQEQVGDAWDVLGTVLAATPPRARGGNPLAHLLALWAQIHRSFVIWLLKRSSTHRWLKPTGKLYLSNLIVLEKPLSLHSTTLTAHG